VQGALERHVLADANVSDVAQVPPATRRRADFKIARRGSDVLIGFHEARAHKIVDMHECLVLVPEIVAVLPRLRQGLANVLRDGEKAELHVTQAENGLDGVLGLKRPLDPARALDLARLAQALGFVRLLAGKDLLFSLDAPFVHFGKAKVKLPPQAFLQPTREGEAMLQARVMDLVGNAKSVVDLFAGCGTFTLPLAERAKVHAVEIDRKMIAALADAARGTSGLKPVATEARDLFKLPLAASELERFDAVVLDPPRAGAQAQARALAASRVKRVAYVSCDAESFARDARILVDGGYRLGDVVPVDQFLWSGHIELVAGLERPRR
jgi:23S rRNA (uracil1939-C5)-methyltransferase